MSIEERFWEKVKKTPTCWLWTGALNKGHGVFQDQKQIYAHRFAYELLRDSIPAGLQLDHLCRNRACVNPDHLEAVSCRTNLLRGKTLASLNANKQFCKNGHPFDETNTYVRPNGEGRTCISCRRTAKKRHYERHYARLREEARRRMRLLRKAKE